MPYLRAQNLLIPVQMGWVRHRLNFRDLARQLPKNGGKNPFQLTTSMSGYENEQ